MSATKHLWNKLYQIPTSLPEKRSRGNTSSLILWVQNYPNTKTRWRYYKKRKLLISISHGHSHKRPNKIIANQSQQYIKKTTTWGGISELKIYTLLPASSYFPIHSSGLFYSLLLFLLFYSVTESLTFAILRFCIEVIPWTICFSVSNISLSRMTSSFIHIITNGRISFFFKPEWHSSVCIY